MSDRPLPRPVSAGEIYLAAVLDELRMLRRDLNEMFDVLTSSPSEQQEETTPSLPAGFPGKAELEAAGYTAISDIPRTAKSLKAIHGIGPATATEILKALPKKQ